MNKGLSAATILAAVMLAGCASAPPPNVHYVRVDGGPVDPAQLKTDSTICLGEKDKADLSAQRQSCGLIGCMEQEAEILQKLNGVVKACMASRGYVLATR